MNHTVDASLGFLSKLVNVDVLQQGLVEMALGVVLHLDASHSTQAFQFYRYDIPQTAAATANALIKEVDLRVPVNSQRAGQEFLVLTLLPRDGLTASSIMARFGQPSRLVAPTPQERMGTGISVTYVYLMGKRQVSFSFGAEPQELLQSIAMEKSKP